MLVSKAVMILVSLRGVALMSLQAPARTHKEHLGSTEEPGEKYHTAPVLQLATEFCHPATSSKAALNPNPQTLNPKP